MALERACVVGRVVALEQGVAAGERGVAAAGGEGWQEMDASRPESGESRRIAAESGGGAEASKEKLCLFVAEPRLNRSNDPLAPVVLDNRY